MIEQFRLRSSSMDFEWHCSTRARCAPVMPRQDGYVLLTLLLMVALMGIFALRF